MQGAGLIFPEYFPVHGSAGGSIRKKAAINTGKLLQITEIRPLLHFVQKLASNDNFDIVFRQVENLEAHIFKISVSICLAKHSPHFVIESLHGGIG